MANSKVVSKVPIRVALLVIFLVTYLYAVRYFSLQGVFLTASVLFAVLIVAVLFLSAVM